MRTYWIAQPCFLKFSSISVSYTGYSMRTENTSELSYWVSSIILTAPFLCRIPLGGFQFYFQVVFYILYLLLLVIASDWCPHQSMAWGAVDYSVGAPGRSWVSLPVYWPRTDLHTNVHQQSSYQKFFPFPNPIPSCYGICGTNQSTSYF